MTEVEPKETGTNFPSNGGQVRYEGQDQVRYEGQDLVEQIARLAVEVTGAKSGIESEECFTLLLGMALSSGIGAGMTPDAIRAKVETMLSRAALYDADTKGTIQ